MFVIFFPESRVLISIAQSTTARAKRNKCTVVDSDVEELPSSKLTPKTESNTNEPCGSGVQTRRTRALLAEKRKPSEHLFGPASLIEYCRHV